MRVRKKGLSILFDFSQNRQKKYTSIITLKFYHRELWLFRSMALWLMRERKSFSETWKITKTIFWYFRHLKIFFSRGLKLLFRWILIKITQLVSSFSGNWKITKTIFLVFQTFKFFFFHED